MLMLFFPYSGKVPETVVEDGGLEPLYIVIGCALFIILSLVLFVVVGRKRARGISWFPEGFFLRGSESGASSSKRHRPDGGEELK